MKRAHVDAQRHVWLKELLYFEDKPERVDWHTVQLGGLAAQAASPGPDLLKDGSTHQRFAGASERRLKSHLRLSDVANEFNGRTIVRVEVRRLHIDMNDR